MSQPNARLYFLLARTPLHMGCGDSLGAIDKPTKRHVVTSHPQIPGTSLKGCIKDPAARDWRIGGQPLNEGQRSALFGDVGKTGMLSPQDGILLLLPAACWAGGWAWVTSPAVLRRLRRAALGTALTAGDHPPPGVPVLPDSTTALACAGSPLITSHQGGSHIVLLEEVLDYQEDLCTAAWAEWLCRLAMAGEPADWVADFQRRVVVVHDEVMDWLCTVGTDVRARNRIDDDGVAADHALWREECVPEDSLFYGTLCAQPVPGNAAGLSERAALAAPGACDLQLGGKGSVGYGWASFRPLAMADVMP